MCMAQTDKQPEFFPEAKVRLRPRSSPTTRASRDGRATRTNPSWEKPHRRSFVSSRRLAPPPSPATESADRPLTLTLTLTSSPPSPPQVFCNGEEVMTVGGTQAEYVVDIWSGNHPFFLGKSTAIMTNAGQVSRFGDKYGDLGAMSEV